MIKKLLLDISWAIYTMDDRVGKFRSYGEMRNHPGWETHQKFMVIIANKMSEYMFSDAFTKLSAEEKDIAQRTMHSTKEIIDFLLDPLKKATKLAKVQAWNKKLGATQGKQPK